MPAHTPLHVVVVLPPRIDQFPVLVDIIPARRLDRFGRLANALGRGPPDDRDGGGRSHSPVELLLLGATAGAADCP